MASRNIKDLHGILAYAWNRAKEEYNKKFPLSEVFVTCTYRSNEEQNDLYAQGRTKPGKNITNAKAGQSPHNYWPSFAFDIAFKNGNNVDWNPEHFKSFANIIKSIDERVEWGGDWIRFKDFPHFELKGWKELRNDSVKN